MWESIKTRMAAEQEFVSAWKVRFPGEPAPLLTCFETDHCDTFHDSALRNSLQSVLKGVEELKRELEQQHFVAAYLGDLLQSGGDRLIARIDQITPNGTLHANPDSTDKSSSNIDEVDGTVEGQSNKDGTPVWRLSRSLSRPSGQSEGASKETFFVRGTSGKGSINKGNRQNQNGGASVKHNVISGASESAPSRATATAVLGHSVSNLDQNTDEYRRDTNQHVSLLERGSLERHSFGPSSTTARTLSHMQTGDRNSLTDTEKVKAKQLLSKTYSEGGTAERKHKPPIPAPRLSRRGPTFKRPGSGGSFKGILMRSESTDSTDSMQDTNSNPDTKDTEKQHVIPSPKNSPGINRKVPMLKPLRNRSSTLLITHDLKTMDSTDTTVMDMSPSVNMTQDPEPTIIGETKADDSGVETGSGTISPKTRRSQRTRYPHAYANVDIDLNRKIIIGPDIGSTSSDTLEDEDYDDDDKAIYDNPVPFNKDETDDTSSDEEEPIYYNIMLMKKSTMQKLTMDHPGTIYASVDVERRDLERQAKRLSKRFSHQFDSIEGPPVPTKAKLSPFPSDDELDTRDDPGNNNNQGCAIYICGGRRCNNITQNSIYLTSNILSNMHKGPSIIVNIFTRVQTVR